MMIRMRSYDSAVVSPYLSHFCHHKMGVDDIWRFPKMMVPQIIQVMNNHNFVLKSPW